MLTQSVDTLTRHTRHTPTHKHTPQEPKRTAPCFLQQKQTRQLSRHTLRKRVLKERSRSCHRHSVHFPMPPQLPARLSRARRRRLLPRAARGSAEKTTRYARARVCGAPSAPPPLLLIPPGARFATRGPRQGQGGAAQQARSHVARRNWIPAPARLEQT